MKQLIRVNITKEGEYEHLHFELINKLKHLSRLSIKWQRDPIHQSWYGLSYSLDYCYGTQAIEVSKFFTSIAAKLHYLESPGEVWKALNGVYAEYNSKLGRFTSIEEAALSIYHFDRGTGELYSIQACKHDKDAYKINQQLFHGVMFYKNTGKKVGWHSHIWDVETFTKQA